MPLTKVAAGPHFRDGAAVIYDSKQDRSTEFDWNVLTNNITDTAITLNLRDFDLDDRLQYTAITPDPVFVGANWRLLVPLANRIPIKFFIRWILRELTGLNCQRN